MKRLFTIISISLVLASCSPHRINMLVLNKEITLVFQNTVNGNPLQLGETYFNPYNEAYTPTMFKYYISNISMQTEGGKNETIPETYFLVNETDTANKKLTIYASPKIYKSISFLIGVDSIKNVSGTQSGALDPANGMFWTWNTGYIMAKIEANSPVSTMFNNKTEFHIGGFKGENNTLRMVTLYFPGEPKSVQQIVIEADINKWFNGVHALPIAKHAVCTTPGNLAKQYADNYATMFTIKEVRE